MGAFNRIPLVRAVQELKVNSEELTTVKGWAGHMGYSRSHFSRCIKKQFGRTPKVILAEVRLEQVKEAILEDPDAIGYKIASDANFTDDRALYKFLNNHCEMTFTEFRQEVL